MSNQQEFNFIIDTGFLRGDEQETFFDGDEIDAILPAHADMGDILVAAGVFTSKGQARKAVGKINGISHSGGLISPKINSSLTTQMLRCHRTRLSKHLFSVGLES